MGNELDLDNKTISSWFTLLEASFITFKLQPYHKNFNKRLIKTPKIYFYDIGLLCHLLGIRTETDLENHYAKGSIFEILVVLEFIKNATNTKSNSKHYFWRDATQNEVDLIVENGINTNAFEIKSGKTINKSYFNGLDYFKKINPETNLGVIYGGFETQKRTNYNIYTINDLPLL